MKHVIAILLVAVALGGCSTLKSEWDKLNTSASGGTAQPAEQSPYPPNTNFGGS